MILSETNLEHELKIVWEIDDPMALPYVRETLVRAGTRQRGVPWRKQGRRIGYAVLTPTAPSLRPGTFPRRLFFLKPYDRSEKPEGTYSKGAPMEGVDPRTIEPGKPGEQNARAWGEPLPSSGHDGATL
jgi:hypothetical protein